MYVIDYMFMLIFFVVVFGMVGSFDFDYVGLIGLLLGGFIVFGVCLLLVGWLGDIWSWWWMMLLFFFGIGVVVLFIGLVGSVLMLVIGLILIGVFVVIYYLVGIVMLVVYVENCGCEIGINGMWGNFGVVFVVLFIGFFIVYFGWCVVFILFGGVVILFGIGFFFCVCEELLLYLLVKVVVCGEDSEGLLMCWVFGVLVLVIVIGGVVFNVSIVIYLKLF